MRLSSKRRWLRFSVRTLLIAVTIFCVWLGYCANWRVQREAAIDREVLVSSLLDIADDTGVMPLGLRLVAASPQEVLWIPDDECSPQKLKRLRALFPEATILNPNPRPSSQPVPDPNQS